jgi:hypothetical protein
MTWNYRIMRHYGEETFYAIHEVYYDDNGTVEWWTEKAEVISDTVEGILEVLSMMHDASLKDILDYETAAPFNEKEKAHQRT